MHDLERIGLFKEMSYVTIGAPYAPPLQTSIKFTGKNFIVPGSKIPCAKQDGYFNEFSRVFDGERNFVSYADLLRQWRRNSSSKNLGKAWIPSSGDVKQSGVGSSAGCITKIIPAFNNVSKTGAYVSEGKNFLTNPGKKGTGYGYSNVCLNPYPEYMMGNKYSDFEGIYKKLDEYHQLKVGGRPTFLPSSSFVNYSGNPYIGGSPEFRPVAPLVPIERPFIPSSFPKKDGGMKDGTFTPFPTYNSGVYQDSRPYLFKDYLDKMGKRLLPNNSFPTYYPTISVLDKNVKLRCNNTNIGKVNRVMTY